MPIKLILLFFFFCDVALAASAKDETPILLAPGYGALTFEAPLAGSYQLPPLGYAEDGEVLNTEGNSLSLESLYGDKVTLLSFIYATCDDVNGCPLSTAVFHKIKQRLQQESGLKENLRLITLSFDPKHDTPKIMAGFANSLQNDKVDWRFLTTKSQRELQPILKNYNQVVSQNYDEDGKPKSTFSHTLRVYLIDKSRKIRNVYSIAFLHPDIIINDVKTILLENKKSSQLNESFKPKLHGAGDDKTGYENKSYKTNSKALLKRVGKKADLLSLIKSPPLGLPKVPIPDDNPVTTEKLALGRKLFFDRRLSLNNTFSCAMCHVPEQGFSHNELAVAVGVEGRSGRRNSPTLFNVGYSKKLFHDGREDSLEQQIWGPLLAHNEMANPSPAIVLRKLRILKDYRGLFENVFNKAADMDSLGKALATYQRSLNSANSSFDQWYFGKQETAITATAKRGFQLFIGKARCAACHTINKDYALFTDYRMHNTGHGYNVSTYKRPNKQKLLIAPGQYIEIDADLFDSVSEKKPSDIGLYEITETPADRWKYKTPTLRNIALTSPYMHDGAFNTLQDVIQFYNQGGVQNKNLDPLIKPLGLSNHESDDLLAFLNSLTGSNVDTLISDAYAAPVGDTE